VADYFRDVIVARLTDLLGENLQTIFDLPKVYDELAMGLKARVHDDFAKYGIELVDLFLGAITPPDEVQAVIDERTGMAALGDMNAYLKFKTARAVGDAAQQGGSAGVLNAGLGVGVGAGLGMMLPGMLRDSAPGGSAPPAGGSPQPAPPPSGPAAAAGAAAAGGEEAAAAATPAFCSQCGTKLPPGSRFCPSCGAKVG
jgi:membrane protease subunit (stomatin/prohibitin family)